MFLFCCLCLLHFVSNHNIITVTFDGKIHCIDEERGDEVWEYDTGQRIISTTGQKAPIMSISGNFYYLEYNRALKAYLSLFLPFHFLSQTLPFSLSDFLTVPDFVQLDIRYSTRTYHTLFLLDKESGKPLTDSSYTNPSNVVAIERTLYVLNALNLTDKSHMYDFLTFIINAYIVF